ncbi:MAG: SH3 domain-containing protein [Syntrophales bacterium]|nr:SH3 domain-containing protein [Syntrophales bacterium]
MNFNRAVAMFLVGGALLLTAGCAAERVLAPSPLPHVKPEYEKAEFWAARQPDIAKVIAGEERIREINRGALLLDTALVDIFAARPVKREDLLAFFSRLRAEYDLKTFYGHSNFPLRRNFFDGVFEDMDLGSLPAEAVPEYALVVRETDMREIPTHEIGMKEPYDNEFDYFQYSRLECGTPLAVLHFSRGRKWCFVQASFAKGWVQAADIAFGRIEDVQRFVNSPPLAAIGNGADVYADPGWRRHAFRLPMGAAVPYLTSAPEHYRVMLPVSDARGKLRFREGYVKNSELVSVGYLPYTTEGVLRQAFLLRGQPYGWGGMFGGRDCSRFLRDVFRSFGIQLPVNSMRQSNFHPGRKSLEGMTDGEKKAVLRDFEGRPALLYLRGHIMLLLGVVEDRVYAIHSTWAYREESEPTPRVYHIGGVAVSDLSLRGSSGETLLSRIKAVTPIY